MNAEQLIDELLEVSGTANARTGKVSISFESGPLVKVGDKLTLTKGTKSVSGVVKSFDRGDPWSGGREETVEITSDGKKFSGYYDRRKKEWVLA